ncbi:(2E,6E)-farnesyl diphosphate synthase [Pelagibaculum spongiae]|uniref:(2E,6E)-farnesyl diphosphate synthase n=2 Tax=Pelagibaculum spongiae TaxID=2080658 RepID=A0A2V1H3K5_9GAMM|nr:(2E,6E)-farnesyl diphosphate synthase [Pelagibaculum spongiae]
MKQYLKSASCDAQLEQAMHYALFNGGKRIRPMLVYAAAQACGLSKIKVGFAAAALEMIHSYSLVHDDLPAMDDDDLRRGKPTCHIAFNEATAILVGDALQALAFDVLSQPQLDISGSAQLQMINALARAAGGMGMCGGQALDIAATGQSLDLLGLEQVHQHKTGDLIRASVRVGALAAQASQQQLDALDQYASCIGLSFQIQDDILDVEGDTEVIGKPQGADQALNKSTYPALMGLDAAKSKALDLHNQALEALSGFADEAEPLRQLSEYIIARDR